MPDDVWVDLADAIEGLREALTEAIDRGAGQGMHFRVDPIELTLQVAVKAGVNGKVAWKVLEVGGSREASATQTLTVKLTPVWRMQGGAVVDDPLIHATIPAGPAGGAQASSPAAEPIGTPAAGPRQPDPDDE